MPTTTADRIFNFSAGPAALPLPVLEQAQRDLLCLPGAGASILEISHRSKQFGEILEAAIADLTSLLAIPSGYKVIFLQGGSRLQFSMVPMNLLGQGQTASYLITGSWGSKAYDEAVKEGDAKIVWNGKDGNYSRLPVKGDYEIPANSAYTYYTSNETIQGVQFLQEPDAGGSPLICDASSDFLCRPLPVDQYGMIYACAQKNAGPAGVTVAIIREDLLERSQDSLPGYCNYKQHADNGSMYNTPPTFGIYIMGLVIKWLQNEVGGLDAMYAQNRSKSDLLYSVIDGSGGFYTGHAEPSCRSIMNVTFTLPNQDLEAEFVKQAAAQQLASLKGHRSVGGIRASVYNAMPVAGVEALRDFMKDFAAKNG